jgi:hypothetical protein
MRFGVIIQDGIKVRKEGGNSKEQNGTGRKAREMEDSDWRSESEKCGMEGEINAKGKTQRKSWLR